MPLTVSITPGYVFSANEIITIDKLNAFAQMSIALAGSVTAATLGPASVGTANLQPGSVTTPILAAGAVTTPILAPGAVDAETASVDDYGYGDATAGGTAAIAVTLSDSPTPAAYKKGQQFSFRLTDGPCPASATVNVGGLGAVALVKNVLTPVAAGDFAENQMVLIEHDGANFQMLSPVPPAALTPALTAGGLYCWTGSPGSRAVIPAATAAIVASQVIVYPKPSGPPQLLGAVSLTVNSAVNGVNGLDTGAPAATTWYYLWVIWNPTTQTVAGLMSLSSTAPTLPANYTAQVLVGACNTNATPAIVPFYQNGGQVSIIPVASLTLSSAGGGTYLATSLAAYAPPIARFVQGAMGVQSTAYGAHCSVAMDAAGTGAQYSVGFCDGALGPDGWGSVNSFNVPCAASAGNCTVYWKANGAANTHEMVITGYTL